MTRPRALRRLPLWIEQEGGLRFSCTGCGDCCRGTDGYVWIDDVESARLAEHLGLAQSVFARRYLRLVDGEVALVDKPGPGGWCVFWEDGRGCSVYEARPDQCRTFPFWPEHLRGPSEWAALGRECPGVRAGAAPGSTARLYPPAEVRALAAGRGATSPGPGAPPIGGTAAASESVAGPDAAPHAEPDGAEARP